MNPQGGPIVSYVGLLTPQISAALDGPQAMFAVGDQPLLGFGATNSGSGFTVVIAAGGLGLANFTGSYLPGPPTNSGVMLRWSDTAGASWMNPISRSLGLAGQTYTNLQWRRLGMGRNFIFEISWSSPAPDALTGAFLLYDDGAT